MPTSATRLEPGDPAPPFELLDQHRHEVRLEDFRGRVVLVYFYPEADTPGCTTQSCDLRDQRPDLDALGVVVVGISPDDPEKQLAFDRKYDLGFPLLADERHAVADAWGVWDDGEIVRSSFLVDGHGRIEHAWYRVKAIETVPKALAALAQSTTGANTRSFPTRVTDG